MPSPFPGMDPYLEAPDLWPDFHDRLAYEISAELNRSLPAPYYARLEMRPEVGIVDRGGTPQRIVPDVAVVRRVPGAGGGPRPAGGVGLLEEPRRDVTGSVEISTADEPIRHHFVEIRDPSRGHKLVTLLEIVSPSNKRPGPDREAYRRKQREILESDASLVEIDLLRSGERVLPNPGLDAQIRRIDPRPDYLVMVSHPWGRAAGIACRIYPCTLREWLPCFAVPLKQTEPEVPLDLQYVVNRVYDAGPYRRGAIDYSGPADPPLGPDDEGWAVELLRDARGGH